MSYEAWNEDDSCAPDGYIPQDEHDDLVDESFVRGAQSCREMMARFVEQAGDPTTAMSIRANWHPGWGPDPGLPEDIATLDEFSRIRRAAESIGVRAARKGKR